MGAGDVALVRWPAQRDDRERLRATRHPRLLLLEDGIDPPACEDGLEDWIRLPAPEADLQARLATLRRRATDAGGPPVLDDDGVLRVDGAWVALPPIESRLVAALLDRIGTVVTRNDVTRAGWPDGDPVRNVLDVHILRLRRRLEPLGLAIRTVRSRGFLLERARP
jgi:DNA-binding response OmpR family regulator